MPRSKLLGELLRILINPLRQIHLPEHRNNVFERGGGLFEKLPSAAEILIEVVLPCAGICGGQKSPGFLQDLIFSFVASSPKKKRISQLRADYAYTFLRS